MAFTSSKQQAMNLLEEARREYLEEARVVAKQIAMEGNGTCTVDQVRDVCPPPKEMDGRVMGAVFNSSDWEHAGYERSNRTTCHKRPISRFRMVSMPSAALSGAARASL
jgi:hypothetical protein